MGIYYRGDNRGPNGPAGIFKWGFERRGAGKMSVNLKNGLCDVRGDMHPAAAVCMTKRLEVCPIFPVTNDNPRWIYAFFLDESFIKDPSRYSQYVDTHKWQKQNGFKWPDYAWEEAIGAIDPPDIIGAVKVQIQRIQCNSFGVGPGPFKARFQALEVSESPYCKLDPGLKSAEIINLKDWKERNSNSFCGVTPDPDDQTSRPF